MDSYKLGVLYGDGIGPEVVKATVDVLQSASKQSNLASFDLTQLPMGFDGIEKHDSPMPQVTKDRLEQLDGWIMGPNDGAAYPEKHKKTRNPSGELRHYFDLYANVRPSKSLPGIKGIVKNADLVIYRENTEGFYPDRNMYVGTGEMQVTPEVVITTGVFTKKAIERIARAAFDAAMVRRKKVTIVHKANVIKLGSGLFKDVCLEVAKDYPEVEVDDYHVDAMTALLVRHIDQFDVIVTENMFGDILSDLTGELVGSLGLAPSINTNSNQAMAQATHGAAPDIAGKNIANPVGMMLSTVMLLQWLGNRHSDQQLIELANLIESSIFEVMKAGKTTRDLGGNESTSSFSEKVIEVLMSEK